LIFYCLLALFSFAIGTEQETNVGYFVIGNEYTRGCLTISGGLLKIMTHDCTSNVSIWERPTNTNNNIYFRNRLTGQLLADYGGWTPSFVQTDDNRARWNFGYRHGIYAWVRNVATGRYIQWTTGPTIILTPINIGWSNHFRIYRMTTPPPPLPPVRLPPAPKFTPVGLPAPKPRPPVPVKVLPAVGPRPAPAIIAKPKIYTKPRPSFKYAPTICAFPTNYHYIIKSVPANQCLRRTKKGVVLGKCNLNVNSIWKIFRTKNGRFTIRGRKNWRWLRWRRRRVGPNRRRGFHLGKRPHRYTIPSLANNQPYNYSQIRWRNKCLTWSPRYISWQPCNPTVSQLWIFVHIVVSVKDVTRNSKNNAIKLSDDKIRTCVQKNQNSQ